MIGGVAGMAAKARRGSLVHIVGSPRSHFPLGSVARPVESLGRAILVEVSARILKRARGISRAAAASKEMKERKG